VLVHPSGKDKSRPVIGLSDFADRQHLPGFCKERIPLGLWYVPPELGANEPCTNQINPDGRQRVSFVQNTSEGFFRDLLDDTIDCAFPGLQPRSIELVSLSTLEVGLVLPPGHRFATTNEIPYEKLRDEAWIFPPREKECAQSSVRDLLKVIGHQRVIQNLHSTESGLTSHQRAKFLGNDASQAGNSKDKGPGNDSGNDVVKSLT